MWMICVVSGCQDRERGRESVFLPVGCKERESEIRSFFFYLREGSGGSTDSPSTSQCLEVSRETGERVCVRTQSITVWRKGELVLR